MRTIQHATKSDTGFAPPPAAVLGALRAFAVKTGEQVELQLKSGWTIVAYPNGFVWSHAH